MFYVINKNYNNYNIIIKIIIKINIKIIVQIFKDFFYNQI